MAHPIAVLNGADPRGSQRPGVYAAAVRCLETLLWITPSGRSRGG